jgi:pyruvate dehydrogenase E2 component (dihydrolipoamide acetyltransferase)
MASVVRMPSVLAGATEAAIANWLVAAGDTVTVGDPLAEIETEKAIVEYSAEEAGIVGRIVLAAGDSGEIGAPIAVLVKDGETDADIDAALGGGAPAATPAPGMPAAASAPDPAAPAAPDAVSPSAPPAPSSGPAMPAAPSSPAMPAASSGPLAPAGLTTPQPDGGQPARAASQTRIFASPIVRKVAREKGIDLAAIAGSGPNGRIVRRDLERLAGQGGPAEAEAHDGAQAAPQTPAPQTAVPQAAVPQPAAAPASAASTLIPHTAIRRAIARRLTESKTTTPHFYMTTDCVVDELLGLRERINETAPVKISVNDFVIMAVAAAFQEVPEANVTWSDEGLVAYASVDVSIAVATDGGLVTPVLRGVEAKRLSVIAAEARSLAQRARDRRLLQHELEGGAFSVSNLGMYGTLEFSAIINPPQSGILAVGAAKPQAVVVDGAVTVATVMRCTLSVDHRAIDGALAARWLAAFTARIQDPMGMII